MSLTRSSLSNATLVESITLEKKLCIYMFGTLEKFFEIIFTVKKLRMINFLLIILFLVNAPGVYNMHTDSSNAEQSDFNKYLVSIQLSGDHLCTGTMIDETHILTIAHVFIGKQVSHLSAMVGQSVVMHPLFHPVPVRKIFLHPAFLPSVNPGEAFRGYWTNDIAILRLADRFYSNHTHAVQFMKREISWAACPQCVMISWAHSREDPAILFQIWDIVLTIREAECNQSGIRVQQNEACFIDLMQNLLITSGKLGSPIVCDGVMIGFAVKVTDNRAPGTPSTFLNVLPYLGFINDVQTNAQAAVAPGEFPYIVSIWDKNNHICGGFILDKTHILTTRHCLRKSEKFDLKIASGNSETSYLKRTTKWSMVRDIIYHPSDPGHGYISDDIAVIVLAAPLIFGLTANSLQYKNASGVSSQSRCLSFHWRYTMHREKYMKMTVKLMKTYIAIIDNEKCRGMLLFPIENQFCAGNPYYMHIADTRDIGNPVICAGELVGMMVGAFPRNDNSPPVAIFLKLYLYEEFIRYAMGR